MLRLKKGREPDINCLYAANIENVWPHYFKHLLLRYTVHESTWKYTYATQFCPQPFTFAFNLCGVFAVCFTHRGPCQKKRGPSAWAWHFSSLPLARPAIFAHTCACNFPRCLSALPPTWDALWSHLPMNPGVPSPHPATSCHGRLYFWCPEGQCSDLSSFNVTSHIYHPGVRTRNSHRKWASLVGYCGCKYAG